MRLSVDTSQITRAGQRLSGAAALIRGDAEGVAKVVAERACDELAKATPRSPDLPHNEQGTHAADLWRVQEMGPGSWGVANDATSPEGVPYLNFLFTGTQPHLIEPVNASLLHFVAGGDEVFAREVHHPGTHANAALVDTLAAQRAHADEAMHAVGGGIVERLAAALRLG